MAEQIFVDLVRSVDGRINNLTTTMGAQGVAKIVHQFDGSKPKEFKDWIKSIEKFATLTSVQADRIKLIAYQSSKGPVSDFLKRFLEQNDTANWDRIKAELRGRFGEVVDCQYALLLLRKVKQGQSEPVQVYAERLLALAEDAFEGQPQDAAQRQLVGYFIDGLCSDNLKLKVMRANSDTFADAVTVATREQNLQKRFVLRTGHSIKQTSGMSNSGHEPMDIDHLRPKLTCHYCQKRGHKAKDCHKRKRDEANIHSLAVKPIKKQIVCYNCGVAGHIARNCTRPRSNQSSLNANASRM